MEEFRSRGHQPRPYDLTRPEEVEEALLHWDELAPEVLEALAAHPEHGPRLALLRRADSWLEVQACLADSELFEVTDGPEPTADELYDYGRGPGYKPLSAERRLQIEHYLESHPELEPAVHALATPPPAPLEDVVLTGGDAEEREAAAPAPAPLPSLAAHRARRQRHVLWIPAAAAAAVLAVGLVWEPGIVSGGSFPEPALLRGAEENPLAFPRGRVLATTTAGLSEEARDLLWANAASFELEAPEADAYRLELRRHSGGAFERGDLVFSVSSEEPRFAFQPGELDDEGRAFALEAGHYTWEVWATVQGLDKPLGLRDFQVVEDEKVARRIGRLDAERLARHGVNKVRELHAAGFVTDARSLARTLPETPERDHYLGHRPGR